jgi:hypothetical protein
MERFGADRVRLNLLPKPNASDAGGVNDARLFGAHPQGLSLTPAAADAMMEGASG